MMHKSALLIIDAQVNMFDESMPIHNADQLLANLVALRTKAQQANVPTIFVRHDGGVGEPDEFGTPGWHIHPQLEAKESDIFIDKRTPDSFYGTQLQAQLNELKVESLIVAGMQTDFCINATTRRASELGFAVALISDAHSTFDGDDKAAAEVISEHNADLGKIASLRLTAEWV